MVNRYVKLYKSFLPLHNFLPVVRMPVDRWAYASCRRPGGIKWYARKSCCPKINLWACCFCGRCTITYLPDLPPAASFGYLTKKCREVSL